MKKQLLLVALLFVGSLSFAQKQNEEFDQQINDLIQAENYEEAIDSLLKWDADNRLSEFLLTELFRCYFLNEQYQECIQSCYRWLGEYEIVGGEGNKYSANVYLGRSYYLNGDCEPALFWLKKSLNVMEAADFTEGSWNNIYTDSYSKINKDLGLTCYMIGICYGKLGMSNEDEDVKLAIIKQALQYFKRAIKFQCLFLNTSIKDVQNSKISDDALGAYLKDYGIIYVLQGNPDGFEIIKLAALCGNQDAISICNESNINYRVKSNISNNLFE